MMKLSSRSWMKSLFSARPWLFLLLFSLIAGPLLAVEERYLNEGHPDGRFILAPPPAPGSAEAAADLATVRAVSKARTLAEEARALKSAGLSFDLFEPAIGPLLDLAMLPKTDALLKKVKDEMGDVIDLPKDLWKRKRPYQMDPELAVGHSESSYGYPSGHSTRGMLYALLMCELFATNEPAVMEIGKRIGWDRVILAKHYPTDIHAGRVMAIAIFRTLRENPAFQRDLAAAKEEIETARQNLQSDRLR